MDMNKPYLRSRSFSHFLTTSKVGDTYGHTLPIEGPTKLAQVNAIRQDCSARVMSTIYRKNLTGKFTTSSEVMLLPDGSAVGVTVIKRIKE